MRCHDYDHGGPPMKSGDPKKPIQKHQMKSIWRPHGRLALDSKKIASL